MTVTEFLREAFVDGPEGRSSEFLEEYRKITEGLREEISELKETLEGDPKRRWPGVVDRLEVLERRQREKDGLLEAWEKEQERKAWTDSRNARFQRIFQTGLGLIAVILSILVAIQQLTGGF